MARACRSIQARSGISGRAFSQWRRDGRIVKRVTLSFFSCSPAFCLPFLLSPSAAPVVCLHTVIDAAALAHVGEIAVHALVPGLASRSKATALFSLTKHDS